VIGEKFWNAPVYLAVDRVKCARLLDARSKDGVPVPDLFFHGQA